LRVRTLVALSFLSAVLPPAASAAVKPGLEGAQELFRQNHWEEARAHLRSQWGSLSEKDRPTATFLIGRSYVREAEFYRAAHRVGAEVGLAYMEELAAARANRGVAWIPLFKGLYEVEAGRNAEAERTLLAVTAAPSALPPEWKAAARLRRALAVHRLGRVQEAATALKDPSPEGRFCRLLLGGAAEPPPAPPKEGRREKLLTAALLFRAGRAAEAEALLVGLNPDVPDVEDRSDPRKLLRFHDPLVTSAWERIGWERAVAALTPLAAGAPGAEKSLAAFYVGLSLFRLGVPDESAKLLQGASASLGPDLQSSARLLLAPSAWKVRAPTGPELLTLWEGTEAQPDAVLLWEEMRRGDLAKTEPFLTKLEARLRDMLQSSSERPPGALVGRWGLARLGHGDDPAVLLAALSEHRDKSNKNKLEWNDPLLLMALSAASYRNREYPQALETLFELSKTFPGLRALQWNLQGIYAARQRAGGEARISQ
jgi:tetratricopeptide (TPR) repeat protein